MGSILLALVLSLSSDPAYVSDGPKITIDHNTGTEATGAFHFKTVPSPVKNDAGAKAKIALIVGRKDSNSPDLAVLTDGVVPSGQDEPLSNFFFNDGSDGGRLRMDFGEAIEIFQVNTYSWHASSRAPQVYNLYASDGTASDFNPAPDGNTHPARCGWKLIATVDTRPKQGNHGGQYGVSIQGESGAIGRYRYLLFDSVPSEYNDPFGNTFFSEIDVIAK